MIEVSRLKDVNAAELFLGFRIGAVGRRDFAVFPVQGQRGLRRLKRYFGNNMSVGAQMVIVLKAFVEHCVSLVFGHPFDFSWLDVSQTAQTDVFHRFLLVSCDSESRSSSFCYQIVVWETENRQLLHFFLFQLPNPLLQELPLWFLLGQRQSFLIRGPSLSGPAEPAVHIRAGGMRQVIICQFAMLQHRVDMRQTGLWTIAHGNGHGTIELYNWRRLNSQQSVV